MKIGFSFWGYCESIDASTIANTPDGLRYCRPLIVNEMSARGHQIYALQQKRECTGYPGLLYADHHFPDLDVLFIEWRWPTYKNSGELKFEPDLDRQLELLDYYHGKVPIVIWDTDLKLTSLDEKRWPLAIIADPSIDPITLTRSRTRLNYCTDFKRIVNYDGARIEYGYIGNNYERKAMFKKYVTTPSGQLRNMGIQTKVYGNWLQVSPERDHPSILIKESPYVAFCDRVGFTESMRLQGTFLCTTHITKDTYAKRGFVPPRYLEALACHTISLVPQEFKYNTILGTRWCVGSGDDIVNAVKQISKLRGSDIDNILSEQEYNLKNCGYDFSVSGVVNFIEGCT